MELAVVPMDLDDINQVLEVDRESYTLPWPASAYRREILHNRNARYIVLRDEATRTNASPNGDHHQRSLFPFLRWPLRSSEDQAARRGAVLGYAGMWLMVDEAHITTIAMREAHRGHGFGELLLVSLIHEAQALHISRMTLEVRVSNEAAQRLYRKYGFSQQGVRPRYYSDNNEDAYIMTTGEIQAPGYRRMLDGGIRALRARLVDGQGLGIHAQALESFAATARAADVE